MIVGLVGPISSGKGTVAKYLQENHDAGIYKFSDVLRDVSQRLHLEITRENLQNLSTCLRKEMGEDILAKAIAEDVEKDDHDIVVVDGIRRWADIMHLKKKSNFILTGIEAEPKLRYQRLVQRGENHGDSDKSYEQFLEDQGQEADAEIPEIIKEAQEIIENNHDLKNLYNDIEKILIKYGKKKR